MAIGGSWYLSAMLLGMLLMYPFIRKYTDNFLKLVAPILAIFMLGWLSNVIGSSKPCLEFRDGVCLGIVRAVAEMSVGCIVFTVSQALTKLAKKRLFSILLTFAEITSYIGAALIMINCYRTYRDFIFIFLIAMGLTISFSGHSYLNTITARLPIKWASKFSLAVYLTHMVWISALQRINIPISYSAQMLIVFILSIASAVVCIFTVDWISGLRTKKQAN